MSIQKIILIKFRNFDKKEVPFSKGTTVIVGSNATGKTNILEAIHMLSTGKSFRAGVEGETVNSSSHVARVSGIVDDERQTKLEIILTRGQVEVGEGRFERSQKKKLLVNGVSKRLIDFSGNLKTVLFGPWDMDLVSGPPSLRRNFLDTVLSQVDREYRRSLLSYEKGLRQRNRILWDIREASVFGTAGRERLHFWDKLLIKNGNYLTQCRHDFIDFANSTLQKSPTTYYLQYNMSAISESRLMEYEKEEVAAAQTLVGPHRDDMEFKVKSETTKFESDLATYGSRGEQRMGVLWLKLEELSFVEEKTGVKPALLLDDIFSELDHTHRDVVMKVVNKQQTIITTADEHFVEGLSESKIIKLN